MKKRNWYDVFNAVCYSMQESGELPENLEFFASYEWVRTCPFDPINQEPLFARVDRGINNDVYLSLWLIVDGGKKLRIGIFALLDCTADDVVVMAALYGKFINALYKWKMWNCDI